MSSWWRRIGTGWLCQGIFVAHNGEGTVQGAQRKGHVLRMPVFMHLCWEVLRLIIGRAGACSWLMLTYM